MVRRAIKAVVYGFFGTLLSGALILGPLIFVIEARAAGQRTQAVESAHAELSDLIDAGTILAVAFPDEAEWPEAQRREPMRRATCRDKDLELMVKEVRARAALCITEDGASRRMFVVGLAWDEVDWKVWTHPDGDSYARFWVRLQEVREATHIVDQLCDGLPAGPVMAKVPRIIKVPEGEAWVATENPLGEMGYYVVSKGGLGPFRVKIRTASFNNVSILPWVTRGVYVPDVVTILASLYFILGDIDR